MTTIIGKRRFVAEIMSDIEAAEAQVRKTGGRNIREYVRLM
jgi:hypothetical protein